MKVVDMKPQAAENLLKGFGAAGFQATELARASGILREMLADRECTVFFAFTSNMMASGLRGLFIDLARRRLFDAAITAGGSLDHDFIRSFEDYEIGSFAEDDVRLHRGSVNRLGNILVPNARYVSFEKRVRPVLEALYRRRRTVSPGDISAELGDFLKKRKSFLGECRKNGIPVFCPGITDSALGLQLYYVKQDHADFAVDVTADMGALGTMVLSAKRTGALVLGGGISKHHTIAVNLLRGGLDYAVYVTTAAEYDGSLSGARASEAKSWGKVAEKGATATVHGDASIVFPLLHASLGEGLKMRS
ncbi:MAG: deoxyhypusine synthase [Candidatus Micrarchaeota archaeon]